MEGVCCSVAAVRAYPSQQGRQLASTRRPHGVLFIPPTESRLTEIALVSVLDVGRAVGPNGNPNSSSSTSIAEKWRYEHCVSKIIT